MHHKRMCASRHPILQTYPFISSSTSRTRQERRELFKKARLSSIRGLFMERYALAGHLSVTFGIHPNIHNEPLVTITKYCLGGARFTLEEWLNFLTYHGEIIHHLKGLNKKRRSEIVVQKGITIRFRYHYNEPNIVVICGRIDGNLLTAHNAIWINLNMWRRLMSLKNLIPRAVQKRQFWCPRVKSVIQCLRKEYEKECSSAGIEKLNLSDKIFLYEKACNSFYKKYKHHPEKYEYSHILCVQELKQFYKSSFIQM